MPSSLMIFSARAISWIWKRMVSRVLEQERDDVAERHAAPALEGDDLAAELVALALVGAEVG